MAEPFADRAVEAAFAAFPDHARAALVNLRALIFATAGEIGAGPVEEALRWGQPAYLAPQGSTLRLGIAKTGEAALFVNCRTTLIEDFRPLAPAGSRFEGSRAILFDGPDGIDAAALSVLIARALSWHRRANRGGIRQGHRNGRRRQP